MTLTDPSSNGTPGSIEPVFAAALRQHQAGALEPAEQGYRRVLAAAPRHADSLHLLGVIALQTGRHALALDLIRRALALAPHQAVYHLNLGNALLASGQPSDAAARFREALRLAPGDPRARSGLGDALRDQGQLIEAAQCYRAAITATPDNPATHNNLGAVLYRQRRLEEAATALRQALTIDPNHEEALFNLGCLLAEQRDYQAAVTHLQRARDLNPNRADTHNNLGGIHLMEGRAAESIPCFQAALRARPDFAEALGNLGAAHARLQRFKEAAASCRAALRLKPDHAEARNNLAMALLAAGDMAAGWPLYESRWDVEPGRGNKPRFTQPQWHGEPGEGRTLLIHAEQGFGDTIQFCRYAPLARQRGWRIVLAAPPPLLRLLSGLQGVDALAALGDPMPEFDRHCPMLSLPLAMGTTVETIPATIPYLHADTAQAAEWRARLAPQDHAPDHAPDHARDHAGPRIGLAWRGARHTGLAIAAATDRQRSLPPDRLAPLLAINGLRFFSLQKDGPPYGPPLRDHMAEMRDFADTAALVANMDLVISVDTAIAHLAGALGRPVWLLDRFGHCWRWLAGRRDSPWYPTMRIYRQPAPDDWDSVIAEAAAGLRHLAETWHAAPPDPRGGKFAKNEDRYRRALALEPRSTAALNGLGNACLEAGQLDEAIACYRQALAIDPDFPDALGNLGRALLRQDRLDEAADHLERAATLRPGLELAHFHLAEARRRREQLEAAVASYHAALALNPNREIAHHNLGATYLRLADPAAATACFRTAIRLRPDFPEAHNNLAMALLTQGNMPEGWHEHEWRWRVAPASEAKRDFPQPQWRGEPAAGKTLLIHAEQGYGDTLQFCRYVPLAARRGLRVIVEAPPPLIRLLHGLSGIDRLVPTGHALPPFDLHCPMMSLPLAFGTTLNTIPGDAPYLFSDSAEAAAWAARLAPTVRAGPRIGVAWAGGARAAWPAAAEIDRRRSLPPEHLTPLLSVPGLQFFSLQIGGPPAPAGPPLTDFMDQMRDFADTAALVANLDLVISVDTAVAHLAGALGRPVCLLDRFDHCWRWLAGRRDTPWYPAMRIYRQPRPGDWSSVIAEVATDLRALSDGWHAAMDGRAPVGQT